MIKTYNEYHLGDQLHHLNYLCKACDLDPSLDFIHYCKQEYIPQLLPLTEGTFISLDDLSCRGDAVNAWIGADNYFYNSPLRHDWTAFHLDWFSHLSNQLGILNPMQSPDSFLFDYPTLNKKKYPTHDYLIINSVPMSNQLPGYDPFFFANKTRELLNKGHSVITTLPTGLCQSTVEMGMSVTDIGNVSIYCKNIISVDTGPLWTTFNVHNKDTVQSRLVYSCAHNVNLLNAVTSPILR